ncbi:hypothetical protein CTI12_AA297160 [Artemisia annua]|uniref:Reverse transcriptase zinc-binding domain-containing protein n=1 Tax=Artemisia annua TaxID=35608 RepID=A0A2U1N5V2_ARTAN|nr:hypothetical protein CTI12_AA297160 [Artemisia annua]
MQTLIPGMNLALMEDRWVWTLECLGNFTVRSTRIPIDKEMIPTRVHLDARGLDIPSVSCPICEECSESTAHVFFECSFVTQILNGWSGLGLFG